MQGFSLYIYYLSIDLSRHKRTNHAIEMDAKSVAAAAVIKGKNMLNILDDKNGLLYDHHNQQEIEAAPSLLAANRRLDGGRRDGIKPVSAATNVNGISIQYPGSRERQVKV